MSLGREFPLPLILGLRNVRAVLCHLFRCFDPRFKENIHWHPVFIIRDINNCRKGYSKGRLKSRESDHFNIQIAFKFHHKHSAMSSARSLRHSYQEVEKSAVTPFNSVTTWCVASRIVPLNVDKDGGMFCGGFCKKSVSYNTYSSDSSSWILTGLLSSFFDKCWYLWWRKRDGKGHSL